MDRMRTLEGVLLMSSRFWKRILVGALLLGGASLKTHSSPPQSEISPLSNRRNYIGDEACRACHSEKVESYRATAHHLTSQLPTRESILGSFAPDRSILKTVEPRLVFSHGVQAGWFLSNCRVGSTSCFVLTHGKNGCCNRLRKKRPNLSLLAGRPPFS